jgi:hypothetical protein
MAGCVDLEQFKRTKDRTMRKHLIAIALASALSMAGTSAQAQGNLLDKATSLFGKIGNLGGSTGGTSSDPALSLEEIFGGLTEAIWVGAQKVIGQLGANDGFNKDDRIHIPLPDMLRTVQDLMSKFGMSQYGDALETRLNRGAEKAMPVAKDVLFDSIKGMTWQDAQGILNGPKDAATQFFKHETTGTLTEKFRPIIDETLAEAGALQAYDSMLGQHKSLPLVPDVKADLTNHVLGLALNALFLYLGEQEAAIRENPAARTTDLLQKVFGG